MAKSNMGPFPQREQDRGHTKMTKPGMPADPVHGGKQLPNNFNRKANVATDPPQGVNNHPAWPGFKKWTGVKGPGGKSKD